MDIAQPTGSVVERLLAAPSSVWFYLYKALLPVDLAYTYPVWHPRADRLQAWLPLIAAVVASLVLWWYRRGWSRPLMFAWGFYCVALMPATGVTEKLVIADRYQHVALIALMALVAGSWETLRQRAHPSARRLLYAVAVLVTGAYAFLTWQQSALYSDSVTLMQAAVDTYPGSAPAHHNVGFALLRAGRLQEAREHLEDALRIEPDYVDAHKTLAATLTEAGQPQEAIAHFQAVLALVPDDPSASYNVGAALREAGRPEEAIEYFQRALQSRPNYSLAHSNLGKALLEVGRPAEAIEQFQQALRIDPDDREARQRLETALSLKPGLARGK
jgi:tetratricopeptide (TPR) repeat protein